MHIFGSSRLKKQIDAKEQERREMSAHVNDGEMRTISCDCLKDYNTGEMVWTEAYPPYNEVQRRKMTKEEMQPSLLEFQKKPLVFPSLPEGEGVDFDAQTAADSSEENPDSVNSTEEDGETACSRCKWEGSENCPDCFDNDMFEFSAAAAPAQEVVAQ